MSNEHSESRNIDYDRHGSVGVVNEAAAKREKEEPKAGFEPVSLWAFITAGVVLLLGGAYLGAYSGDFKMDNFYAVANYKPAPRPDMGAGEVEEDTRPWIEQWMAGGKSVYNTCQGCHQANGQGLPGQFPPLVGSDWVTGGTERLGMIMMAGIQGPLTVKGQTYNGIMPAQGPILTDEQIAQVMTYIRRSWGNDASPVTAEMVSAARTEYGGRATPFSESELKAVPADAMLPGPEVDLQTGEPVGADGSGEEAAEPAAEEEAAGS